MSCPKLYRPIKISKLPQSDCELRVEVYQIRCFLLPYKLTDNNPAKLAAFYVQARLGNLAKHVKKPKACKYVANGVTQFNWRTRWEIKLPSLDIQPRLKFEIFDDKSHGLGNYKLCATVDIKLRSLVDEIVLNKKPILKKKQWLFMQHPSYPEVAAQSRLASHPQ